MQQLSLLSKADHGRFLWRLPDPQGRSSRRRSLQCLDSKLTRIVNRTYADCSDDQGEAWFHHAPTTGGLRTFLVKHAAAE